MVTTISLQGVKSPFKAVAEYPPALPYIGQDSAYYRLQSFAQAMRAEEQAHFLALFGDWAIGKSRLAHEVIAQFHSQSKGWILTTGQHAEPLLTPLMQGGDVIPLFVSFVDVINFEQFGIEQGTAMGKVTCAAAYALAKNKRESHYRLFQALREALTEVSPNFDFERLAEIANYSSHGYAERSAQIVDALGQMTGGRIKRVLVIVDEVESGGDVNPFAEEMQKEIANRPIPIRAVRDLYSGVKDATNTNAYSRLNFLFFNSEAARLLAQMESLERRMLSADLDKASAADLDQLIKALRQSDYPLYDTLEDLARRAFFAADRNFGWFSFIMNRAHYALVNMPDLSVDRVFAEVYSGTGKVFRPSVFDDRDIAPPALKGAMRRVIYNQIPTTLADLGIDPALRQAMLDYKDPFQTRFIGEAVAVATSADQLTSALLATSRYMSDEQPTLTGESSVRFDPAKVLDSLRTFAWRGSDSQAHLWIYTDAADFQNQVGFAYAGFGVNLSAETARTIHKILLERCRIADQEPMVAPTMALLLRFNDLWGKAAANDWLNEADWEKLISAIDSAPQLKNERLLRGVANVLFDAPQVVTPAPYPNVRAPSLTLKLESYEPFNVTARNQLVLLKAHQTPAETSNDLRAIGQWVPVLLLFDQPRELEAWKTHVAEAHEEHLAIRAICHVVEPQTREWEFYVRYALRDAQDGFKTGDVSQRGKDLRHEFSEALNQRFKQWLAAAEQDGFVLRPFYPSKSANTPAFRDFAQSWAALLRAGSMAALGAEASGVKKDLETYDREQSDKTLTLTEGQGAERHASIPAVVSHLLDILQAQPQKLPELADRVFFARGPSAVSFPTNAAGVIEQLLELLQRIDVVEMDAQSRYVFRTVASFNSKFDQAFQRLGSQDKELSGYSAQVAHLSDPVKSLAQQLSVNQAQLILLKSQTLSPEKERLGKLPLARLTTLPPDQQAFAEVARGVGKVSAALDEVLGRPGPPETPPEIDPHTLKENISQIAEDKSYQRYPIEYRVTFLQKLQESLAQTERDLRAKLAAASASLAQPQGHEEPAFPTRPLQSLLDSVQADLDGRLSTTTLPAQLRSGPQDTQPLTILKDAGRLSDVLLKLEWYTAQLNEQNSNGWWVRYTTARERWKHVRTEHKQVEGAWSRLERYFAGTAPEHAVLFMGPSLAIDQKELAEDVASFAASRDDAQARLDELDTEIEGIHTRSEALAERINAARSDADAELQKLLDDSHEAAVRHLAERLNKATVLPDRLRVLNAPTHQEAHSALTRYLQQIDELGAGFCERPELYTYYLEIYRDWSQKMSGEQIFGRHDEKVLRELAERKLITLRNTVDV